MKKLILVLALLLAGLQAGHAERRVHFDGCQYVDALATGPYATQCPEGFRTHLQTVVPFPASGGVLHHRVGLVSGTFVIAGQGHQDGRGWLWNGARWVDLGPSYGTSVAAIGPLGVYLSTPGTIDNIKVFNTTGQQVYAITKAVGVRGIAAIVGAGTSAADVKSVDEWYGRDGLAEYTEACGTLVGQGAAGGLVVKHDSGQPSILEPGNVQFTRAHCAGAVFASAAWKIPERRSVIVWFDTRDLLLLPRVPTSGGGTTGGGGTTQTTPHKLDVVQDTATRDEVGKKLFDRIRADTSEHGDKEALGLFTRRVAIRLHEADENWGALTKQPGEEQWDGYASDAIIYKTTQQVVDIVAFPNFHQHKWAAATPSWQLVEKRETNHWAKPPAMPAVIGGGSSGGGGSTGSGATIRELEQKLAEANARIDALTRELADATHQAEAAAHYRDQYLRERDEARAEKAALLVELDALRSKQPRCEVTGLPSWVRTIVGAGRLGCRVVLE